MNPHWLWHCHGSPMLWQKEVLWISYSDWQWHDGDIPLETNMKPMNMHKHCILFIYPQGTSSPQILQSLGNSFFAVNPSGMTYGKDLIISCQPRINRPWFINKGGTPQIVIIKYLHGTVPIQQLRSLLIQGWNIIGFRVDYFPIFTTH